MSRPRADYWHGELLTAMRIAGGHNPTATHRLQLEAHSDATMVKLFDRIPVEGLRDGWTTEGGTILTFADSSRLAIVDATDPGGMTKTLLVVEEPAESNLYQPS
jgi:hypothetical protein